MSSKDPTGPFPSTEQLRSGDVSYALKNKAPMAMAQSFDGFPAPTSDPLAAAASTNDKNAAIVEKDPVRLQDQYAGVWGPKF
jgi:hypothetical protein